MENFKRLFLLELSFSSLSESDGCADPPVCSGAAPGSQTTECNSAVLHLHPNAGETQSIFRKSTFLSTFFYRNKGTRCKYSTAKDGGG